MTIFRRTYVATYHITYNVSDNASNAAAEVVRTIYVVDDVNPYVESVAVIDKHSVQVTFSKDMGAGVLVPSNYEVSGSGRGTLALNPDTVTAIDTTNYLLAWSCPEIMLDGGDIRITVNEAVLDYANNPMVDPLSGTHEEGAVAVSL